MSRKLADIFLKIQKPELAKEIYERVLLLGNIGFEVYYEYAHVCIILKDTDKAEKILKKVLELKPDYAKAHKDLGVIYLSKRLLDYAKDEFQLALQYTPEDDSIISEYANFLHATSEFEEADKYYEKALAINDKAYTTYAFSALNKIFTKDYDKALEYIDIAIGHSVQNAFFLYVAGKIRFLKENYEDAKTYLIKSLEMDDNIETKSLLAMCYYALENYEQAKNIYTSLLKINEYNINVLFRLAQCENKLGNNDKALELLEKTVEISPEYEEAQELIREIS
jgi:tetratricopeptide (TPR) repeat protein